MASTPLPSPANLPDDREYLVNLYNQLWVNLTGAETRLLQFLGLYGVAVGSVRTQNTAPQNRMGGAKSVGRPLRSSRFWLLSWSKS